MKKIRALMLILLAALFCACSQTPAETEPPTEPTVPAETGTTETEPPTEPTEPGPEVTEIVMSFVGDCLLGSDFGTHKEGSYNWYADNNPQSYFFSGVESVFKADDITVVDCESALTDQQLAPIYKEEDPGYWYYGPTENAQAFALGGIDIASVANNHTGDYGQPGYLDTIAALEAVGVTPGIDLQPIYKEVKGLTVGVLCCNCWSTYHSSKIIPIIGEMREQADLVVIFPHGGSMNDYVPDAWRVGSYRDFIDAGADLVIGDHPHVLQPLEYYNDGIIVYCLGNFCYGGSTRPENAGMIFSATATFIDGVFDSVNCEVIPCYLYTTPRNNYKPELIPPTDPAYNRIVEFMYGLRDKPIE